MSKVVYLMGAGASFGTRKNGTILSGIPIVSEIPSELRHWANEITATEWGTHASYNPTDRKEMFNVDLNEAQTKLSNDLKWLANECENHSTIDTYAKKLFLTDDIYNYRRLKRALAAFLLIEQVAHRADMRYDAFLANILNRKKEIPDDITIVTWNYDSQFEIALSGFDVRFTNMGNSPICLPVYSDKDHKDKYKIFKINGSATFSDDRPLSSFCKATEQNLSEKELKREILWYYGHNTLKPDLSFAWDKEYSSSIYEILGEKVRTAATLVVIGYTFPYFNRETDRKFLSMMLNLRRIIIQDPNAESIVSNVEAVFHDHRLSNNIEIKIEKHTDSFLIPREL